MVFVIVSENVSMLTIALKFLTSATSNILYKPYHNLTNIMYGARGLESA